MEKIIIATFPIIVIENVSYAQVNNQYVLLSTLEKQLDKLKARPENFCEFKPPLNINNVANIRIDNICCKFSIVDTFVVMDGYSEQLRVQAGMERIELPSAKIIEGDFFP